jgi:hypothetical protein
VAISMATQEAVWLRRFLSGLAPAEVAKSTVIIITSTKEFQNDSL